MIINIASSHRFHLLDLARELSRQGHDVRFYSYVPTKRCEKFGLQKSQCVCLLPYVLPFFVFEKLFPNATWHRKWRDRVMDFLVGHFMRRCDIYIALGTVYLDSFRQAKKRFGAKTILEWGSKHIDEQQRILASIGAKVNDEYFNIRSRKAYDEADYIAVASKHVVDSFLKHGYQESKLLKNPYGVDLSDFYPIKDSVKEYDVIMVGNWGYQKGCDLIVEAIKGTSYKFLHVGSLTDVPFPEDDPRFTHVDPVDQKKLLVYYNKAKVFLFPSRQDGFGMVLSQAVACNLPIAGSLDCGAPDLQKMVALPEYITLIEDYTPEAVIKALDYILAKYEELKDKVYAGSAINELTWKAYGERYSKLIATNMGGVRILALYNKYDVIMVGGWSLRKGCDLIVDAIKQTNYKLLHVGGIVDMPFPSNDSRFTHVDSVDQKTLHQYYNMAKVFVLPSREEGLAMVQAQAIACNLPLIGSKDSGAEDLKQLVDQPQFITIVKDFTIDAVIEAINLGLSNFNRLSSKIYAGNIKEYMTWEAYGKRYCEHLKSIN